MSEDRHSFGDDFSDNTDSDGEDQSPNNAPIMSIFASYYGIEDPAVPPESKIVKDGIDDVHFQPEKFVKDLLLNEPIESLVSKDAEMVHEIRTLDGEMQKLVYDNYNKFITATETIKEMKKDVFAMDHDMDTVKLKMNKIATDSKELDSILEDKRAQVDKLVRVKRLLQRLEFLSELPERLSQMIDQQLYREAVQLYHKTISVLTRHSHVLSFKNIKERTELMMADLTEKVINLLEDPTLEAVKLTQYISVLRMMNAPSHKVLQKLLSAHQHRSLRLITSFQNNLKKANAITTAAKEMTGDLQESLQLLESLQELSKARQFHQHVLVGLIEACKGVFELFDPSLSTNNAGVVNVQEIQQAYDALRQMITSIMKEYSKTLAMAYQRFFTRFQSYFQSDPIDFTNTLSEADQRLLHECHSLLYPNTTSNTTGAASKVEETRASRSGSQSSDGASDGDEEEKQEDGSHHEGQGANPQSVNRFELHEERNGWLLLARQSIMDVMYLDSMLKDSAFRLLGISYKSQSNHPISCKSPQKTATHNSKISEEIPTHAMYFADMILHEIHTHNTMMRQYLVQSYLQHVMTCWMPKILMLTPFPHLGKTGLDGKTASSPDFPTDSCQSLLTSRQKLVQYSTVLSHILHHIHQECMESFAECIRYYKPVLDIYEAVETESAFVTLLTSELTSSFMEDMIQQIMSACQLTLQVVPSSSASSSEQYYKKRGNTSPNRDQNDEDGDQNINNTNDIYEVEPCEKMSSNTVEDNRGKEKVQDVLLFLFAALLRHQRHDGLLLDQIDTELQQVGFPSLAMAHQRDSCETALDTTIHVLSNLFMEENVSQLTCQFSELCLSFVFADEEEDQQEPSYHITTPLMDYLTNLDLFAQLVYVVLHDPLPNHPMMQSRPEVMRRASMAGGGRPTTTTAATSLQFDIERLFSAKVKIFDDITVTSGAEFFINTVVKASLKQTQEHLRTLILTPRAYSSLQSSLSMLKQCSLCVMKDIPDIEFLIDQVLHTAFSRYANANDIANATDANEITLITRAVQEGFTFFTEKAVLMIRPR